MQSLGFGILRELCIYTAQPDQSGATGLIYVALLLLLRSDTGLGKVERITTTSAAPPLISPRATNAAAEARCSKNKRASHTPLTERSSVGGYPSQTNQVSAVSDKEKKKHGVHGVGFTEGEG